MLVLFVGFAVLKGCSIGAVHNRRVQPVPAPLSFKGRGDLSQCAAGTCGIDAVRRWKQQCKAARSWSGSCATSGDHENAMVYTSSTAYAVVLVTGIMYAFHVED